MDQASDAGTLVVQSGELTSILGEGCEYESRKLVKLGEQALGLHEKCVGIGKDFLRATIVCGATLLEAKQILPHGEFGKWCKANFADSTGLCERTAQRYMAATTAFMEHTEFKGRNVSQTTLRTLVKSPMFEEFWTLRQKSLPKANPNAWETTPKVLEAVRKVLKEINCDPCATAWPDGVCFAETNYTVDQDGLSEASTWLGTSFIAPGHSGDLKPWMSKAKSELANGNLTEAILCLPVESLNWPESTSLPPFALSTSPLDAVFYVAKGKSQIIQPVVRKLPSRSVFYYLSREPDLESFAEAFRDIGVVFERYKSTSNIIVCEPTVRRPRQSKAPVEVASQN